MKPSTRRRFSIILSVLLLSSSMPVMAANTKGNYVVPSKSALVSNRLIVKYKANNLARGLSVSQIKAQLMEPLTVQTVSQLQSAAGVALTESHAIFNGAHVLSIAGQPNRQIIDNAIAGIRMLPNIEYVEEDAIMTTQAVPNDAYYTTGPTGNPGLWGLKPATTVASPAPGATGNYGADFQTAWNSVTGTGVVVAVVDTGITPHVDIVGAGGTVAAGAGSNLVSTGYDFITDCRLRGTCASTTADLSAYVAPSANATDLGDFLTSADCTTVGSIFNGCTVSNSSWHGTHVAGTIAALGNNAAGVIGGAYAAKILPVRVLGKGGGYTSDIANGIMWAAGVASITALYPNPNPAKVINLSLGGSGACGPTYQNAINAAVAAGAVVVVAAGNSDADVANFQPASCANVISVAAIARDGSRAGYSNFSSPVTNTINPTNVTLAAQGGDQGSYSPTFDPGILSTLNAGSTTPVMSGGSNYVYYQGTSMATPHVAAAAALMLAKNSALTPAQIKTILSVSSSLTTFPAFDPLLGWGQWDCFTTGHCGAGILNANRAVQNSTPTVSAPATSDFGSVLVNATANRTIWLTNEWLISAQAGTSMVTGANASLFTIGANNCSGMLIASNGTCLITVSYAPTTAGAHTATLTIPITGAASPTLVSLAGVAGTPLSTSTPSVTAATVNVGQSTTVNVSFTNPNAIAWQTGTVSLSQPAIMVASVDNCSNTTLSAGASCGVTVTVSPTAAGAYSGTASLAMSFGGAPAVATISGTANGLDAATPIVTAPTVNAGQTTTVNLTFTNPNSVAITTGEIALSHPAVMVVLSDACSNMTLAAGASCVVTVDITPASAGSYSETVSLVLSGGGTAAVATISGTANAVPAPASSSGGGGGCSIMPFGADPDISLLLAMLAVGAYGLRRRVVRGRSED